VSTREERWPRFDGAVLRVITAADWAAMFRRERCEANSVRSQIGQKILALNLGKSEPGAARKPATDL
jgi:hypothetical protein